MAIGLAGYLFGYFSHNILTTINSVSTKQTESRLQSSYKFINPLLECDTNAISKNNSLTKLKEKLESEIDTDENDGNPNFTSVYFRDMNNGPWFGINETELFSPASLIKVPLMIAYLKKAEQDPSILEKKLTNTTTYDPKSQNIQPSVTLAPNQEYTIKQLIEQMIVYSDDQSYNLLNSEMSPSELIQVYNDLGVDISKGFTDPTGNIVSVRAYASFFRILFNASYLTPYYSEYALNLLSHVKFTQGLVSGVPQYVTVAHKFGERQYVDTGLKQLHDCGIVYHSHNPYLLCIMTRGNDFKTLEKNISDISKTVYHYLSL